MIETMSLPGRVAMSVDVTEPRETPPPPGRRFAEALATGVETLAGSAGEVVAAALPGGGIGAAAAREMSPGGAAGGAGLGSGERPEGPGGESGTGEGGGGGIDDYWKLQQESQDFNLQFLQLQEGLSQENRRFTAVSNVLKARHDTVKNVIQNIR
ncbi:MAG: hypothetical protein HY907_21050 [Deltaproteobacteria bacterium]|nr:hypothetical protein [Deltaproteobacteria bacterium]